MGEAGKTVVAGGNQKGLRGALAELQEKEGALPRKLDPAKSASETVDKITVDEATFVRMHKADRMASDKLAEGIQGFTKALETLEQLLASRLAELEA